MSLKKSFSKDKKTCKVTFSVSKEAAQGAKKINLAGDFNSWSSTDTPLKQAKDAVVIDSSKLTIPEVMDRIVDAFQESLKLKG